MFETYRLLDANLNRACEGLRVLEDYARLCRGEQALSAKCRDLRHKIREAGKPVAAGCLSGRDADHDVGRKTSAATRLDTRESAADLVEANCKRVQEALRAAEEGMKLLGQYPLAKELEDCRFQSYSLEKSFLASRRSRAEFLRSIGLYGITAEKFSRGRDNFEVVEKMLDAGIRVIQYREKEKSGKEKYAQCVRLREMTANAGAKFIIDDDIALALACGADGVHIGQDDMPIEKARELMGDRIIGLSTHSPAQAEEAVRKGADYIGVGPLYETHTKSDVCAPVGLSYLEYVVSHIPLPFVAIGGIKEHNIAEVARRGAGCICLVTDIVGAEDIPAKVHALQANMKAASAAGKEA